MSFHLLNWKAKWPFVRECVEAFDCDLKQTMGLLAACYSMGGYPVERGRAILGGWRAGIMVQQPGGQMRMRSWHAGVLKEVDLVVCCRVNRVRKQSQVMGWIWSAEWLAKAYTKHPFMILSQKHYLKEGHWRYIMMANHEPGSKPREGPPYPSSRGPIEDAPDRIALPVDAL